MKEALFFFLFLTNKFSKKFNSCSKRKGAFYVLCVVLLISVLEAPVTKPKFENFIECLRNKTSPENPITDAIFIADNTTTFLSSYVSYTKNKRFSSPNLKKLLAIVAAKHVSHVQATVVCAKSNGIQIRIRSGGHDNEGFSYMSSVPFVILDMHNLRSISVDFSSKKAWVEAGATLGELYVKINEASQTLAFPAGVCPTVGAGGHISGGGFGNLMRKFGVTVDHVIDAKLIDVNGKLLNRTTMGEDLFWAIRGGGSSFGVILSWKINLVEVPKILTVFRVNKTLEQGGTDVLYKWQLVANKFPDSLFITAWPRTVSGTKPGERTIAVVFYAQFLGPTDKLTEIMNKSFPELGLRREECHEMSWLNTTLFWANFPAGTPKSVLLDRPMTNSISFKSKSDFVKKPIPKEGLEKLWKTMFKFNNSVSLQLNPYGGVMDRIPATATAFPHRKGNLFKIQYSTMWLDANATESSLAMMKELFEVAEPYVSSNPREAFFNFRDIDIGSNPSGETNVDKAKIYGYKYFLGNLKRLMQVKAKYDPENFFKNEQSIPPVRVKQ
ncbi:PREDICTED: berberine bridge enzyme-like 6 [Camelina sativa]|uniref:Berberine bridge enzyme-like 6 n=1 Tax=Camelina sativa TaxID=90675 RepID=A0ABM1RJL5_CAMSA|nr:PREDICTED: berberine bridge enzyme-like 6 [Camelina sativa]